MIFIYPVSPLVDLVYQYQYQYTECADRRDRAFAMLSVAIDDMAGLNKPGYSLTMSEVLERLLIPWTESRRTLDVMTYRPQQTHPTWRPSYGNRGAVQMPLLYESVQGDNLQIYSASLTKAPEYRILNGEDTSRFLSISGFHIDSVVEIGNTRNYEASASELEWTFLSWKEMSAKISASALDFDTSSQPKGPSDEFLQTSHRRSARSSDNG